MGERELSVEIEKEREFSSGTTICRHCNHIFPSPLRTLLQHKRASQGFSVIPTTHLWRPSPTRNVYVSKAMLAMWNTKRNQISGVVFIFFFSLLVSSLFECHEGHAPRQRRRVRHIYSKYPVRHHGPRDYPARQISEAMVRLWSLGRGGWYRVSAKFKETKKKRVSTNNAQRLHSQPLYKSPARLVITIEGV